MKCETTMMVAQTDGLRRYAAARKLRLIEMLEKHGYCSVREMSREVNVSPMTIRRDLQALEAEHIVRVSHGGARLSVKVQAEPDIDIRLHEHEQQKQMIGKVAATFIEAGDVIGFDAGSTIIHVARNLPDVPLTVVTYSLTSANAVSRSAHCGLQMLGGTFHPESFSFTGLHTTAALRDLRINKLFLAASGLVVSDGLYSTYLFDAEVKKALIDSSQQIILCMDSSKIGRVFLAHFASLERIDVLITDDMLTPTDKEAIEQYHVQIVTVPLQTSEVVTANVEYNRDISM